jgi:hypothetical protein
MISRLHPTAGIIAFMKSRWRVGLPLLLIATAGCASPPKPDAGGAPNTSADIARRVQFTDADIRDQVAIGPITLTRQASGLLRLEMPIRSTTNLALDVEWRVSWRDVNGVRLGAASAWATMAVSPDTSRSITTDSWSVRAADATVELRWAK